MAKTNKWYQTNLTGVRYRKHNTLKINGRYARYYVIRYRNKGKTIEESIGWESSEINKEESYAIRSKIMQNIRMGKHPQSIKGMRRMEEARLQQELIDIENNKIKNVTFSEIISKLIQHMRNEKKDWVNVKNRWNNHFKKDLGNKKLKDVKRKTIEDIKTKLLNTKHMRKDKMLCWVEQFLQKLLQTKTVEEQDHHPKDDSGALSYTIQKHCWSG